MRSGLLTAAILLSVSALASAQSNYDAGTQTLTFGVTQASPNAQLGTGADIDPPVLVDVVPLGLYDVGNTQLDAFRAYGPQAFVIGFNSLADVGAQVPVLNVVAQYTATKSVTLTNFCNQPGVAVNYGGSFNRGTFGAVSGPNANNCLGGGFSDPTPRTYPNQNGPGLLDFDIVLNKPGAYVSAIGMVFDGNNDGSGRDSGDGDWYAVMNGGVLSRGDWIPMLWDGTKRNVSWFGWTDTSGAGINHLHYHRRGGNVTNQCNYDDLSFVISHRVPGDANDDLHTDVQDLAVVAFNYNTTLTGNPEQCWELGDFNGDGVVNVQDLAVVAYNYNNVPPPGAPVPEPMTLGLLTLGGLALIRRRRAV